MKRFYSTIFYLLLLVSMTSINCKSKKVISETEQNLPEKSSRFLLKKLGQKKMEAEWFSSKAKINFEDPYQKAKVTANIRMRKDSVIWMNIKKVGKEAVRVLITLDSIYIINRLDNEYMIKGLDYVEKAYNLPANFQALQTVLLGNALFLSNIKPESQIKDNRYYLSVEKDNVMSEYWLEGQNYQLSKTAFSDIRNDRSVSMTLENYEELDGEQFFSYFRIFNVNTKDSGEVKVDVKFSNVEINTPKSIRFDIPKRYKRVK